MNPWHDVNIGEEAPIIIKSIIEIPKNSTAKYKLCKKTGMLKLEKVLYSSMFYPGNYGFIPKTFCDNKNPLDILVLSQISIVPMCVVRAKVIGVMRMVEGAEIDDKIIAVAVDDLSVSNINDISELPEHTKLELERFFHEYKRWENKSVMTEEFQGKEVAMNIVSKAINDYKGKFV
jgi:inorganic pyrophosphatase